MLNPHISPQRHERKTRSAMKPICNGTARDGIFIALGRFRFIEVLEFWNIRSPDPRKCNIFSAK